MLRGRHGFEGVILSDWAITQRLRRELPHRRHRRTTPADIAMPWGVESLPMRAAVREGRRRPGSTSSAARRSRRCSWRRCGPGATEARLDASVRRVLVADVRARSLREPFVDRGACRDRRRRGAFRAEADAAQRRALVLLEQKRRRAAGGGAGRACISRPRCRGGAQRGLCRSSGSRTHSSPSCGWRRRLETLHPELLLRADAARGAPRLPRRRSGLRGSSQRLRRGCRRS